MAGPKTRAKRRGRRKGWRKPDAMRKAIMIRIGVELWRFVEAERGKLSRGAFIRRVLDRARENRAGAR